MNFRVTASRRANADVAEIISFLKQRSVAGAAAWAAAYYRALDALETTAAGCGRAPEDEFLDRDVRQKLFSTRAGRPYRLLFVIREGEVRVLRIRAPGQDFVGADDVAE